MAVATLGDGRVVRVRVLEREDREREDRERLRCIRAFTGTMLSDNVPMLQLLRAFSPGLRAEWQGAGQLDVEIPLP